MPTPWELVLDPVSLIALAIYAGFMLLEALVPARPLPPSRFWVARGLVAFVAFFLLSSYLPLLWDGWLAPFQLLDLSGLGSLAGTVIGLLVYELGVYLWHRSLHASDRLWRWSHQLHHSAERLDTFGAFWFSPLDMVGWTALGSLCLVLLVGIDPQAATNVLLITFGLSVFQHANLRTPRWLGYLVQRPESHAIHHARGIHRYNYSDLPLFDLLFGTFRNPAAYEHPVGFRPGDSLKLGRMLLGRDLHAGQDEIDTERVERERELQLAS